MIRFVMEKEIEMPCCIKAGYEILRAVDDGYIVECTTCKREYKVFIEYDYNGHLYWVLEQTK